jgi:hypothetical protein
MNALWPRIRILRNLIALALPAPLSAIVFALLAALPTGARAVEGAALPERGDPDPVIVERLLALDPGRISASDVADVLAQFPAPRIILLQGSFGPVTMEPFAEYLIAMGYPEDRIRNPRDGSHSSSSFEDSRQLAGELAWYYENERMFPLVIGHSQGGMLAIRVLYDLAGAFGDAIPVWNPITNASENRTAIVDPVSGERQPVVGLRLPYAAAIATGKLPRLLLGQWTMISKLRRIPDSVVEFTGFSIEWDLIAGQFPGAEPYAATGSATVRNVTLPAAYTHIGLPVTRHLATNAVTRAWIEAYVPGTSALAPDERDVDTTNLVHAADIWHSVKKQWCLKARRLMIARRSVQ